MTLDKFKKLVEAATPGPWRYGSEHNGCRYIGTACDRLLPFVGYSFEVRERDAGFIAACREMVPKLIAVAEAAANPFIEPSDIPALEEHEAYKALRAALDAL